MFSYFICLAPNWSPANRLFIACCDVLQQCGFLRKTLNSYGMLILIASYMYVVFWNGHVNNSGESGEKYLR